MTLTQPQKSIECDSEYGPIFGNYDICIFDQCNINDSSFTEFPTSYNCASKQYANIQASWTAFSGVTDGNKFKVLEYEVFEV